LLVAWQARSRLMLVSDQHWQKISSVFFVILPLLVGGPAKVFQLQLTFFAFLMYFFS
jgi:hypothetical protein